MRGELKPTGPVLANIFLGKIKSWNDPAIAKLNPDMKLPELPIQVLHRNEGKGSNYILSDYLAKVSPEFLATAGRSESPKWPMGQGFRRSQDLVAKLRGTPGAIGYTESAGINRHVVGDERALQERKQRIHPGLESCR